jgi:UrcA family protein
MLTRYHVAAAFVGLLLSTTTAQAQTTQIAVRYSDLDLTQPADLAVLEKRLKTAARRACGGRASIRFVSEHAAFRHCLADARTSYEGQLSIAVNAAAARRVAVIAER